MVCVNLRPALRLLLRLAEGPLGRLTVSCCGRLCFMKKGSLAWVAGATLGRMATILVLVQSEVDPAFFPQRDHCIMPVLYSRYLDFFLPQVLEELSVIVNI